jgi:hypothetical protein
LGKVYRALGEKDKAAAEFAIASRMSRTENEALVQKISGAQTIPR